MHRSLVLVCCTALVLILGVSSSVAGGKGFYVGAQVGISDSDDMVSANNDGSLTGIDDSTNDLSFKAYGGYSFSPYIGVEAGRSEFGETDFKATSSGGPSWTAGMVSTDFEASGYSATAVGRLPIADRWTLFASFGLCHWSTTETFTENGVVSVDRNDGTDTTYGVGAEWDVGEPDETVLRAEYSAGHVDNDGNTIQSLQVGAHFKF